VEDVWKHVEDETDDHLGGCDDNPSTSLRAEALKAEGSGRRLRLVTMWWD
jgi:hypothetical protein